MENFYKFLPSRVDYSEFLFSGFDYNDLSNEYYEIFSRISKDGTRVIVRYACKQVFPTIYGYGLRLGKTKGLRLKPWQVSTVWYDQLGYVCEIILTKGYVKVYDIPVDDDYCNEDYNFNDIWGDMVKIAKLQKDTVVRWKK